LLANDSDADGHTIRLISFDGTPTRNDQILTIGDLTIEPDTSGDFVFSLDGVSRGSGFGVDLNPGDTRTMTFEYLIDDDFAGTSIGSLEVTLVGAQNTPGLILGTFGADTLISSSLDEEIWGGTGEKDVFSFATGGGDDVIKDFRIKSGSIIRENDDIIIDGIEINPNNSYSNITFFQQGADTIIGFGVNDSITLENVELSRWQSRDPLNDFIVNGTAGDDIIDDTYIDTDGDVVDDSGQTINGLDGDDQITAGSDDDSVFGNNGNDTLRGMFGWDELYGGAGDDVLIGGRGEDYLELGMGSDTIKFDDGDGNDYVSDFDINSDEIVINGTLFDPNNTSADATLTQIDTDVLISLVAGGTIWLETVDIAQWQLVSAPTMVSDATSNNAIDWQFVDADGDQAASNSPIVLGLKGDNQIQDAPMAEIVMCDKGEGHFPSNGEADSFVFIDGDDDRLDQVSDWEIGTDLIDVPAWEPVSLGDLAVNQRTGNAGDLFDRLLSGFKDELYRLDDSDAPGFSSFIIDQFLFT